MRYYDISIFYPTKHASNPNADPRKIYRQFSSLRNGVFNPGALMVELDIQQFGESTPKGESRITIWGLSPKDMQQATQNMFGRPIEVRVGMSKGLPLANPKQRGLAIKGVIWKVLGNWQGTELRLDLIVTAEPFPQDDPKQLAPIGLTLPWHKGQKLANALFDCFRTLGGYQFTINVSDRLVNDFERPLFCRNLSSLAKDLKAFSKSIIKDEGYSGVEIAIVNGNQIWVYDNDFANHQNRGEQGSASYLREHPKQIEFSDLVGQPTWINYGTVSVVCVMRGDIKVGSYIRMPKNAQPIMQTSSYSQFRNASSFTGDFQVSSVRFLGNSRQPDGNSWVTIIEAYPAKEVKQA